MNASPDFDRFEIASIEARKRWSKAFLWLCMLTSTFSIVILIVLISTIVISALPVFGPHADHLETDARMLVVQDKSSDAKLLDKGDKLQGIFQGRTLIRGGLGATNDEPVQGSTIGFYSFQLNGQGDQVVQQLEPVTAGQDLVAIMDKLNVDHDVDLGSAVMILLSSETAKIDIASLKTKDSILDATLLDELSNVNDWTLKMVAGIQREADFAQIQFASHNKGDLARFRKTRVRKEAGSLRLLASLLFDADNPKGKYKNIKLRSLVTNEIASSQIKIDDAPITGLSRRKRNGFDLGGTFDPVWCSVPEDDAGVTSHARHFLSAKPSSSKPALAGIGPALWGSVWVCTCCALFALPLGIGTAVFMEEFKPTNRFLRFLQGLIQLNITNLAGVPSIVYGILGLTAFATMFGLFGSSKEPDWQFGAQHYYQYLSESMEPLLIPIEDHKTVPELLVGSMQGTDGDFNPVTVNVIGPDAAAPDDEAVLKWTIRTDAEGGLVSEKPWYYFQIPFGRGVLAASLTLMLVILPVIIIASQEAIRAVPSSLRQGAMGLGATRWQVVRNVTLPAAIPGIMTGAILAVSRAIGEAAPIIVLCGTVFIASAPQHLMDFYSVLPIQIFYLTGMPIDEGGLINFQNVAAAASLVLLIVLLTFNTFAIVLRQMTSKPLS